MALSQSARLEVLDALKAGESVEMSPTHARGRSVAKRLTLVSRS
jgi:hypothetical protein